MVSSKNFLSQLRTRFVNGETLGVAGYSFSVKPAVGFDKLRTASQLSSGLGAQPWVEVLRNGRTDWPPLSAAPPEWFRSQAVVIRQADAPGEPLWVMTHISTNGTLATLSTVLLGGIDHTTAVAGERDQ